MPTEIFEAKISLALWLITSGLIVGISYKASTSVMDRGLFLWAEAVADQLASSAKMAKRWGLSIPFAYSAPQKDIKPVIKVDGDIIMIQIGVRELRFTSETHFAGATLYPDTSYIIEDSGSGVRVRWIPS
jgi:hypothetical protein